jgi:hypothetical protein
MKFETIDIKIKKASDYEDKVVVDSNTGNKYASVLTKSNKFIWKKYDEDEMSNAIKAFKYFNWNWKDLFKYSITDVNKLIRNLKKDLKKEGIFLYYMEHMGRWYDGEIHFIDYLWDDVTKIVDKEYGSWIGKSFVLFDDIHVLHAIQFGKLQIQHNIVSKDIEKFNVVLKNI